MTKRTQCYAYLNARIKPIPRGEIFEDPLIEFLAQRGIGEVIGGGTLQDQDGEIIHCGIDLDLQLTESNIAAVCSFLAGLGAPKGSKLKFERGGRNEAIPFGQTEGIGVYINGTDLPDEVYQSSDINVVIETFDELTSHVCVMRGHWEGPRETALYMYGPSATELQSRISRFIIEYPLCQKARVVRIA